MLWHKQSIEMVCKNGCRVAKRGCLSAFIFWFQENSVLFLLPLMGCLCVCRLSVQAIAIATGMCIFLQHRKQNNGYTFCPIYVVSQYKYVFLQQLLVRPLLSQATFHGTPGVQGKNETG